MGPTGTLVFAIVWTLGVAFSAFTILGSAVPPLSDPVASTVTITSVATYEGSGNGDSCVATYDLRLEDGSIVHSGPEASGSMCRYDVGDILEVTYDRNDPSRVEGLEVAGRTAALVMIGFFALVSVALDVYAIRTFVHSRRQRRAAAGPAAERTSVDDELPPTDWYRSSTQLDMAYWWDGKAWTGHTSTIHSTPPAESPAHPTPRKIHPVSVVVLTLMAFMALPALVGVVMLAYALLTGGQLPTTPAPSPQPSASVTTSPGGQDSAVSQSPCASGFTATFENGQWHSSTTRPDPDADCAVSTGSQSGQHPALYVAVVAVVASVAVAGSRAVAARRRARRQSSL